VEKVKDHDAERKQKRDSRGKGGRNGESDGDDAEEKQISVFHDPCLGKKIDISL